MKKQVATIISFSALLTLSAFAPKVFWQEQGHKNTNRFPASKEDPKPEEQKQVADETTAQCLKDKQSTTLETEIKKLVADKETILEEIDNSKPKKSTAPDKKISKASGNEDIVAILSQVTSMIISQQEQQQMLMQQMYTMMNQLQLQMPMQSYPQQQIHQPQHFMAPMTFSTMQMDMSLYNQQPSIFGNFGGGIGIGYTSTQYSSAPMAAYHNPYSSEQTRTPSAQIDPGFIQKDVSVQPLFQSSYSVGSMGFDFSRAVDPSELERVMF